MHYYNILTYTDCFSYQLLVCYDCFFFLKKSMWLWNSLCPFFLFFFLQQAEELQWLRQPCLLLGNKKNESGLFHNQIDFFFFFKAEISSSLLEITLWTRIHSDIYQVKLKIEGCQILMDILTPCVYWDMRIIVIISFFCHVIFKCRLPSVGGRINLIIWDPDWLKSIIIWIINTLYCLHAATLISLLIRVTVTNDWDFGKDLIICTIIKLILKPVGVKKFNMF